MDFSKECRILSVAELCFTCVTSTAGHIANTHFKEPSAVFSERLVSANVTSFQRGAFPGRTASLAFFPYVNFF